MKQYELIELKKLYLSQIKFTRKASLNLSQKLIITFVLFIMISFISYKSGYLIYIFKESIKYNFEQLSNNMIKLKNESFTMDYNIIDNKNITNNNTNENKTILINEDLLIPVSHSEHLEDLILNSFFPNVQNGFYIDIGNFGVNKKSTTKYFYLKGWTGINIKPSGEEYEELVNLRPKDININYNKGGKMNNKYYFRDSKRLNETFYQISDIFTEYIPKNKEINFCKINIKEDTRKILLSYDFENFRSTIFCIENYNSNITFNISSNLIYEYILNKNDYSFIYQYEANRYYADNKFKGLKEKANYIDAIIQAYKNRNIKAN